MSASLGESLERRNHLTPLRLGLALLVLVAHGASVSGLADHPLIGGIGLGTWAVMAFFCISGYLIAQSRERLALPRFLAHRALRILPGLWVANILTAAVAAPLAAHLAGTRVDLTSALLYPVRNAMLSVQQWTIEGTLTDAPYSDVWNGSLWTLAQEGGWYLFTGVVFLGTVWRRNQVAGSALLLLAMTCLNHVGVPWSILGAFFAAGMLVYALRDRLPVHPTLLAGAAVLVLAAGSLNLVVLLAPLPLAYLVLGGSTVRLPVPMLRTDLSYGVYIYAFPIEQVLAQVGLQRFGLAVFIAVTTVVTVIVAHGSWVLIERPAMELRHRVRSVPHATLIGAADTAMVESR